MDGCVQVLSQAVGAAGHAEELAKSWRSQMMGDRAGDFAGCMEKVAHALKHACTHACTHLPACTQHAVWETCTAAGGFSH